MAQVHRRGTDLWRTAARVLPVKGSKGHQGGESVHGRGAAHHSAGQLRHQRRRAGDREPVAPFTGCCFRGHPASERQDASFLPGHPGSGFLGGLRV